MARKNAKATKVTMKEQHEVREHLAELVANATAIAPEPAPVTPTDAPPVQPAPTVEPAPETKTAHPKMTDEEKKARAKAKRAERKGSSTVDSPVAVVRAVVEEMLAADPNTRRKDILAAVQARGVGYYTAATQVQKFLKARKTAN